jgi:chromosome partitioning protein
MRTIVVANQKGGIGKTTTAMALASLLRNDGHKVLLIDADPQGNASDTYGAVIEGEATLYDVLLERSLSDIKEAIQHTKNGDIIASDPLLRKADECLATDIEGVYHMADALSAVKDLYDDVVIDTAPALNLLLYNCLIAADELIIPVVADRYSIVGLSQLYEAVTAVKRRQNPRLTIKGLLLVKYSGRTNLSKAARDTMNRDAESIGSRLFMTTIRECVKCQEAQAAKQDLFAYAPLCTTACDYQDFYNEAYKKG